MPPSPDTEFPLPDLAAWEALAAKEGGGSPTVLGWQAEDGVEVAALATPADLAGLPHRGVLGAREARTLVLADEVPSLPAAAAEAYLREALAGGAEELRLPAAHLGLLRLAGAQALGPVAFWLVPERDPVVAVRDWLAAARAHGGSPGSPRGGIAHDVWLATLHRAPGAPPAATRREQARAVWSTVLASGTPLAAVEIDGLHAAASGCTAVQQVGLAIAALAEHLRDACGAGAQGDALVRHVALRAGVGTRILLEIAKLRALRLLAAKVLHAFGAAPQAALGVRIAAAADPATLVRQEPHTNLIRAALQAFAAAAAGCDSFLPARYDQRRGAADPMAARLARGVQLLLRHEAHLAHAEDLTAGSFALEALTDRIARAAWSLVQRIEAVGGLARTAGAAWLRDEIAAAQARRSERLRTRRQPIVGTSMFVTEAAGEPDPERDPHVHHESAPFDRLAALARRFRERTGAAPCAHLDVAGGSAVARARAEFSADLLRCAGFDPDAGETGAHLVVLCAEDAAVHAWAQARRARGRGTLLAIAGRPGSPPADVDFHFHRDQDVVATFARVYAALGVPEG
ncbi:MAG: hypothetical protein IT458_03150 [Planctomycetes bacterium]|nr:hypothetical protein [Planctomycetota bacterium]